MVVRILFLVGTPQSDEQSGALQGFEPPPPPVSGVCGFVSNITVPPFRFSLILLAFSRPCAYKLSQFLLLGVIVAQLCQDVLSFLISLFGSPSSPSLSLRASEASAAIQSLKQEKW
jgi:hypothetical protein